MQLRATVLSIMLVLMSTSVGLADGKAPVVAVFDIENRGTKLTDTVMDNLTTYLGARLAEAGYQVIPQAQIRKRLLEQKKESYKACYDQSCQIELGRELAAEKTLSTTLISVGTQCQVTTVLYDLKKAAAELAASAEANCDQEKSMFEAIQDVAGQLGKPLRTAKDEVSFRLAKLKKLFDSSSSTPAGTRSKKAWKIVEPIANNPTISMEIRAKVLKDFLLAFTSQSEQGRAAEKLLGEMLPGALMVKTYPEEAWVKIDGRMAGQGPMVFVREISGGEHQVQATLEGHQVSSQKVNVAPGKQAEVMIRLEELESPYNTLGHITFWPGLAASAFGGFWVVAGIVDEASGNSADDAYIVGGIPLGIGAALLATGLILWSIKPDEDNQEKDNQSAMISISPDGQGVTLSLVGLW